MPGRRLRLLGCPHPVTGGWPSASESEDANGDATGGGRLPRQADAGPAQGRGRKASASGNFPQALQGQVPRGNRARILSPAAGHRLLEAKTQTGTQLTAHGCRERWQCEVEDRQMGLLPHPLEGRAGIQSTWG